MHHPAHIAVCICTYRRPQQLGRLLRDLGSQPTEGRFTFSIVVADNDHLESARMVVSEFQSGSTVPVSYCVQPEQNIALTRNTAVANASGDFVAFIDDDEFPTPTWLLTLYKTCLEYGVDGVLGPVKPYFEEGVPRWVVRGRFYDRPTYPTGFVIDWRKGRTGNVLLKRSIFSGDERPFRPEFLTGEDQDFFRRMIDKGYRFIWCHEAMAYEVVPPIRWKRSFMLKRALLRGKIAVRHTRFGGLEIGKSLVALPLYTLLLPFTLVSGQHAFMKYLIKLFDHTGKLLAMLGLNPAEEKYVTE